jgi:uncharacterized RDD family membrane protein YckC
MPPFPSPLRRLAAFCLDYLLLVVYAGLLFALAPLLPPSLFATPGRSHLISSLLLTLPVVLYFTLGESRPARGTLGKRVLGLAVTTPAGGRPGPARAVLRNGVKFLPWEVAHTFVHRAEVWPEAVTIGGSVAAVAAMLAAGAPILFAADRRALWDRLSGCVVAYRGSEGASRTHPVPPRVVRPQSETP